MTLTEESAERIALLYRAAARNGSLVTVKELSRLLPQEATRQELGEAVISLPQLRSKFELTGDYLTEQQDASQERTLQEGVSRRTARKNMASASEFVALLHSNPFQLVAVSGSTSYGSASHSKDVDLFCVAPTGKTWISLTKGLIAVRIYRLLHRSAPAICLSCVMDDIYAHRVFSSSKDPLFARDALEAKVLKGHGAYISLMKSAHWISSMFPIAYRAAVSKVSEVGPRLEPTGLDRILNGLLFQVVSRYIRFKSALLNRSLKARRRNADMFEVRAAADHLIYESRRYVNLKEDYGTALRPTQPRMTALG